MIFSRILVGALALAVAAPAAAVVANFEAGPFGGQAQGFSPVGVPGLTLFSANGGGGDLFVGNFGSQGNGNSLGVFGDRDGNFLLGTLSSPSTFLSLGFGNDDGNFTNAGDLATLKVYSGASLISTITVVLNRDDVYNQFISYTGSAIDNFSFAYTNAAGSPFTGGGGANIGLTEIVDDITFNAVPEPASWAMLIAGFGLTGAAMRRRRQVAITA